MKRGAVLIIALWSLCLLTVFALQAGFGVRQKITFIQRLNNRNNLHYLAQAALMRAVLEIGKDDPADSADFLKEPWANNIGAFKEVPLGSGVFNVSYDYFNPRSEKYETVYGLVDEERKINLNKASLETLRKLFMELGIDESASQDLAASIIDWRDADSMISVPLGSAEDYYYENLSESYEAKDTPFQAQYELLLVKGVDTEIFEKIKDYVTIYSSSPVNINTAYKPVLLALGLGDELSGKIISFRYGKDNLLGTEDDGVFLSAAAISSQLSQDAGLNALELAQLDNVVSSGLVGVSSANFMVRARAGFSASAGLIQEITCYFNRSGKILSYVEF